MVSGKELTHYGKEVMESNGWTRLACFNSYRAMPRGARGMSDNLYIRDGVLLFIEDKGHGDVLRPKQVIFMALINSLNIPGVRYVVAESEEDYDKYALMGSEDE